MTIQIGEATIGMWCVHMGEGNMLMHLGRSPDGKFALNYRFRWYRDDKIEDSADEKHYYSGTLSGTESEVLRKLRESFEHFLDHSGGQGWELIKGERSAEEYAEALKAMPGIQTREEWVQ